MVGFITDDSNVCYAGKHLLIDMYGCNYIENIDSIKETMIAACIKTGATILYSYLHPFDGGGTSGAVILAESHLSIHTWPENKFIALDMFVCGSCDPYLAIPVLKNAFNPQRVDIKLEKRGTNFCNI